MKLRVLVMLFLITVCACTRDGEPSTDIEGFDYFPLETGMFIIYDVDSVSITQNVETPYQYQLRISIGDSFVNAEGNTSYILQRHTRADETRTWKPAGTWTAWKTSRQAVISEGNTKYIKLQFPVSQGLGWNGNALNDLGGTDRCNGMNCDRYEITSVDPMVIVTQDNSTDVLSKDVRTETYSKGVGLVSKQYEVLMYCEGGDCFGKDFVVQGLKYNMELKESGKL